MIASANREQGQDGYGRRRRVESGGSFLLGRRAGGASAQDAIEDGQDVKDKESIREAGVYKVLDYISKPARPERVRAKITKYLG